MSDPGGYPDDQAYPAWQGPPFQQGNLAVPLTGASIGPELIANWASVFVQLQPEANDISAAVIFSSDALGADVLTQYNLWTAQAMGLGVTLPARGNYVTVDLLNGGAATQTFPVTVAPSNVPVTTPRYDSNNNYLATGFQAAPAGGTTPWQLPVVTPGPASWYFEPGDALGKLNLQVVTAAGVPSANTLIFRRTAPAAEIDGTLWLPDVPVTWQVVNTDATNVHDYHLAVQAPGM